MAEKISRKKKKKNVEPHGIAHIKSTFNNTHVTLTDRFGNVIAWEKAGTSGFKGSRKSTAYAATMAAEKVAQAGLSMGLSSVDVEVKGEDKEDLLFNWLQEIIAAVDIEEKFFSKFEIFLNFPSRIR